MYGQCESVTSSRKGNIVGLERIKGVEKENTIERR